MTVTPHKFMTKVCSVCRGLRVQAYVPVVIAAVCSARCVQGCILALACRHTCLSSSQLCVARGVCRAAFWR